VVVETHFRMECGRDQIVPEGGTAHDVIGRRIVGYLVGGRGIDVCTFRERWWVGGRMAAAVKDQS
jgi:hypothetical protein